MLTKLVIIVEEEVKFPRRVPEKNMGRKLLSHVYLHFPMLNHANSQHQTSNYFGPIFYSATRRGNLNISSTIVTYLMNIHFLDFYSLRSTGSNTGVHLLRVVTILHVFYMGTKNTKSTDCVDRFSSNKVEHIHCA